MNAIAPEQTILKKQANLFRGMESVGGWMTITSNQVVFKPHKINFQTSDVTFLVADIASVAKRNSLFVVPNGLKVTLKSGQVYKFVVWKRDEITKLVEELQQPAG